jgi:hypothetical protein
MSRYTPGSFSSLLSKKEPFGRAYSETKEFGKGLPNGRSPFFFYSIAKYCLLRRRICFMSSDSFYLLLSFII